MTEESPDVTNLGCSIGRIALPKVPPLGRELQTNH